MHGIIKGLSMVAVGVSLLLSAGLVLGQTRPPSQAECQVLRERLADHAKLSEGVQRIVAASAARYPAPTPAQPAARTAQDRAGRLEQITRERQQLDDLRLAAMMRFDVARALDLQKQIEVLDAERARVEQQPASSPAAAPAPPAPSQADTTGVANLERLPCSEIPTTLEAAKKTRRKELGAREDLGAVVPLVSLKGQDRDQIAKDLSAQFSAWPDAALEIGLLDQNGDGRLDGFVDMPVRDLFRLYRQRSDGSLSIEVFPLPGRATETNYDEIARRLDETVVRQMARQLSDLLTAHSVGPVRIVTQTADFATASAQFLAGNFADAGRLGTAAARATEFQNLRGEPARLLEILAPASGSVVMRQLLILPRPNNQEQWDETIITVSPRSYRRSDVELTGIRQGHTSAGAPVGTPTAIGPARFSLER